jgi:catechol 2,3-dioxygenase-like lactoylglutathione lyase family enzyme
MSRVQLALNVSNIDAAVDFYRRLFGTEPAKRRPGYANFAIADPPLKLVLIEGAGEPGTLNHVGVEVASSGEVATEAARLRREGFELFHEDGVTCCYALQDKFWVTGTDNRAWEVYTVLADAPLPEERAAGGCATPDAAASVAGQSACGSARTA